MPRVKCCFLPSSLKPLEQNRFTFTCKPAKKQKNDFPNLLMKEYIMFDVRLFDQKRMVGKMRCEITETSLYVRQLANLTLKTTPVKKVRTTLIHLATQMSKHVGLQGRVFLIASNSSHVFYWKMGFRPMSDFYSDREA